MNNWVSTFAEHLISQLTSKERDVARLLAWGMVQKEIADMLGIDPTTVSVHFRNIYRKIGIHKETDLTRIWIFFENGIADNPFKKIVVCFFLFLSISAIYFENSMPRVFRSTQMRTIARPVKPVRSRRSIRWFDLPQLATA